MKKKLLSILIISSMLLTISSSSAFAAKVIKAKSVSISPTAVTLSVGDTLNMTAKMKPVNATDKITWSSSNSNVATVDETGIVTAVNKGDAKITVKTSNKKSATCKVTVNDYINEEKAINLIKNNTLSSSEVLSMIDKSTSDVYVKKDDINSYIDGNIDKKGYITKEDVDAKLKEDYATKDSLSNYVKKSEMKEFPTFAEIFEGIKTLVSDLIKSLTYSKEEVDTKLSSVYSKSEVDEKIEDVSKSNSSSWTGTVSLNLYDKQQLPMELTRYNTSITIEALTVKKEHCDSFDEDGNYWLYKYVVTAEGNIENPQNYNYIGVLGVNAGAYAGLGIDIRPCDVAINGSFKVTTTLHSDYNFEFFLISGIEAGEC